MRTVVNIILVALLASSLSAVQAQASAAAPQRVEDKKCGEFSQAGRHDCFSKLHAKSTVSLKKAEAAALQKIAQWFENDRYKNIARTTMRSAGVAFVRYREAKCAFADSLRGGAIGNAHEISRLACLGAANTERALELKRYTDHFPPD
ncbi:lysozyme inhibitor LprI family protein [Massilia sp. CCM 8734]|uniref:lysozyme inhibitor LprI family protein n=1 Tax=Massilia sp. CCM 8734 TaxID=2609283 RepID=UPI00141F07AE|nr:lysozyme inhibitor LprI family protein [Massilia sp. CCM 8734]NHZ95197.1 DUF1311 domain-containing protein [Massilia sp. CCM 8734]